MLWKLNFDFLVKNSRALFGVMLMMNEIKSTNIDKIKFYAKKREKLPKKQIGFKNLDKNYFFASAKPRPRRPPKTNIAPPAMAASFLNSLLISFSR